MRAEDKYVVDRDGNYWEASYNPDCPMAGLFNQERLFYFRKLNPEWRWWKFWMPKYTGDIWEGGYDWSEYGFVALDKYRYYKKANTARPRTR